MSTSTKSEPVLHVSVSSVNAWREETLFRAGYPPELAAVIAARPDIDLHQACDLLAASCPVALASRILL